MQDWSTFIFYHTMQIRVHIAHVGRSWHVSVSAPARPLQSGRRARSPTTRVAVVTPMITRVRFQFSRTALPKRRFQEHRLKRKGVTRHLAVEIEYRAQIQVLGNHCALIGDTHQRKFKKLQVCPLQTYEHDTTDYIINYVG